MRRRVAAGEQLALFTAVRGIGETYAEAAAPREALPEALRTVAERKDRAAGLEPRRSIRAGGRRAKRAS